MRHLLLLIALTLSFNLYSQVETPKQFNVFHYDNVDSALLILQKIAMQQFKPAPTFVEITKEYIAQSRQRGAFNPVAGDVRTVTNATTIFLDKITKVQVRDLTVWKIYFSSKVTGQADLFIIKDKEMCEQAFGALMCLIKHSNNKYIN